MSVPENVQNQSLKCIERQVLPSLIIKYIYGIIQLNYILVKDPSNMIKEPKSQTFRMSPKRRHKQSKLS